jgi:DNA polymerase-3 subunit alpha
MDNIGMFGDRKNGRVPIEYPHPLLEDILAETYGIFVYQEQVMEAAKVLAGYSLGEADLLRRAMGKKIQAEMDAQRSRFVEGCAATGIAAAKANELFDLIDKFAGYGFNKSHAAAYALVAYQTAWLKAHHPIEFFAASMCFDMHQTDKLAVFIDDMRRAGHLCLPPSINASEAEFSVEAEGESLAVRYALGALKGVGEKAMEQLVLERTERGRFRDLDDFAGRIDPRMINRRQIESLAGGGAFDEIADRAAVFAAAETILSAASSAADARDSGQGGLFGEGPANVVPIRMPGSESWSLAQRMAQEKESFGFYFSAHPVDNYRHLVEAHGARSFSQVAALPASADGGRTGAVMAGLVEDVRWRTSAKGRRYMMATLSDPSGQFEATVFDDQVAEQVAQAARAGSCGLLTVELDRRPGEETPRVTIRAIQSFESLSKRIRLQLEVELDGPDAVRRLAAAVASARGGQGQLRLKAAFDGGVAELVLGRDFNVDAELAARVERLEGVMAVHLSVVEAPRLALVS